MNQQTGIRQDLHHAKCDVLIIGSGGAGLLAALHAFDSNPALKITVASKGLIGKSGCTRMVQGGYNAALNPHDSVERHFRDTIEGGQWINHQELAWTLVSNAVERLMELESKYGCYFDRNPDGTIHQKAFAGQSFDRTVHKGDLTGIEIMNRLMEQVRVRNIELLEEYRAVELISGRQDEAIAGALFLNIRSGSFHLIQAKIVIIASGAGPTMYKFHTPSADKSCDGLAMALRFGLELRDMEMIQFHPTGLLAGSATRITGTIIEEGLRGAGGQLLDSNNDRFMRRYDPRGERATRDIVSRAMFEQMRDGRTGPNGGVFLTMNHLDASFVKSQFRGMVQRCRDVGFDLVSGLVEVTPTAHYLMGGIEIRPDCTTSRAGVLAAGEDTGGVHGANRLGGNGVGNATVFGGIAGDTAAALLDFGKDHVEPDHDYVHHSMDEALAPLSKPVGNLNEIREHLYRTMWEYAGILRSAESLAKTQVKLEELECELMAQGVANISPLYNMSWQEHLNLGNQILVSQAIVQAALLREESRGAHYRTDFPATGSLKNSCYTRIIFKNHELIPEMREVEFSRISPPDLEE